MEYTVPDTLVLKIVEYDDSTNLPDTTLYIFYDVSYRKYVIRGKRRETPLNKSCTYSFECKFSEDLVDFIEFVIDKSNNVSYIMYNYDNLPFLSNDVTFEFLSDYADVVYEISGYDNKKLKRRNLLRYLIILRNVFNYNN